MSHAEHLKTSIRSGAYDKIFTTLYGEAALAAQYDRYCNAIDAFTARYGDRACMLFSVPGRSEISGNHTDHNHGKVIAAAIDLDIIAVAAKTDDGIITVESEGFPADTVDTAQIAVDPARFFHSDAIIAGTCDGFTKRGLQVGGFVAYTTSNVFKGSGLSSSAAFEVMIGNILSHFYNDGKVEAPELAKIGQYAENVFFGKPCGLMDQTACAVGSFVTIDFKDPTAPIIEKLAFDLSGAGYALCIVNTGGNHADLNDDFASIPAEMKAVAAALGYTVLREASYAELLPQIPALREKVGDRAILRAIHFFFENERVEKQAQALREGDLDTFFAGALASGASSFRYLQNVYTVKNVKEQGLSLALALSEQVLAGKRAAYRVHGGGFAGTIQAFVPVAEVPVYAKAMDAVFGDGACHVLSIRPYGAICTSKLQ